MMTVQNLQFPREGENEERLYIRYDLKGCVLDSIDKRLAFNTRSGAVFDTLFNSFSYEKLTFGIMAIGCDNGRNSGGKNSPKILAITIGALPAFGGKEAWKI